MTARLLVGDVNQRIREIPDGTVDAVICSPPFLALRKYGGDDAEMGSEANPAAFIDALLELTAQFRRVLAPHGSIAIELGDTYSGSGGAGGDYNDNGLREGQAKFRQSGWHRLGSREGQIAHGAEYRKPGTVAAGSALNGGNGWPLAKSLACVPGGYATSLAYGWNVLRRNPDDSPAGRWRVRNVIVWARPNPPVGALGDKVRPATSYITVACTSAKRWFDLDAVRGDVSEWTKHYAENPYPGSEKAAREREIVGPRSGGLAVAGDLAGKNIKSQGAPPLDWWEDDDPTGHATLCLPTQPYPNAHYATWPAPLAKRLVEMLCPLRVCTVCGEPSRRIVGETTYSRFGEECEPDAANFTGLQGRRGSKGHSVASAPTLGWTDCGHNTWHNGHVLDPFSGSATTLSVAHGCGRDATGIELYPVNAQLSQERMGFFLEVI